MVQESPIPEIKMLEKEPPTVDAFLQYLYTSEYDMVESNKAVGLQVKEDPEQAPPEA